MSGLVRIVPPSDMAVSLTDAKSHLRVDFADDDALIEALVKAAIGHVEGPNGFLGRALIEQTWDFYLDTFPKCGWFELPLPPLIEVEGLFYLDGGGTEQEYDAGSYYVDAARQPARISIGSGSWPSVKSVVNAVRVRFRAGYVELGSSPLAPAVPAEIKAAILLYVGTLYSNRETVAVGQSFSQMPWASEQLLRPHRVPLSMA